MALSLRSPQLRLQREALDLLLHRARQQDHHCPPPGQEGAQQQSTNNGSVIGILSHGGPPRGSEPVATSVITDLIGLTDVIDGHHGQCAIERIHVLPVFTNLLCFFHHLSFSIVHDILSYYIVVSYHKCRT